MIAKFFRLEVWQQWLLIKAAFLLPLMSLALALFGLQRVFAFLKISQARKSPKLAPSEIANLVELAARYHPIPSKCLARSLVLWRLLGIYQDEAAIIIGVKKDEAFFAHAWVEYQGIPLNDTLENLAPYQPIFRAAPENLQ